MAKKLKKEEGAKKEEKILPEELDLLKNVCMILTSSAFTLTDLLDQFDASRKGNKRGKR